MQTAYFHEIVAPDGAQESGLMVFGDIPTSGSIVSAHLPSAGTVTVRLEARIDEGVDREGTPWSTWRWVPGSLRPIGEPAPAPPAWQVLRIVGSEPARSLYAGEDEARARHLYEVWSIGLRHGACRLLKSGTVISETHAPRRIV